MSDEYMSKKKREKSLAKVKSARVYFRWVMFVVWICQIVHVHVSECACVCMHAHARNFTHALCILASKLLCV